MSGWGGGRKGAIQNVPANNCEDAITSGSGGGSSCGQEHQWCSASRNSGTAVLHTVSFPLVTSECISFSGARKKNGETLPGCVSQTRRVAVRGLVFSG